MKAVMMSVQPEWCYKIGTKQKSIEVRKSRPKLDTPFKCYIYCTSGEGLWKDGAVIWLNHQQKEIRDIKFPELLNGRVIGEFVCDFVHTYFWQQDESPFQDTGAYYLSPSDLRGSCLTHSDFENYGFDGMDFQTLYGWHISDLKIYDEPLEITQFIKPCPYDEICECCGEYFELEDCCKNAALQIRRPPQSWYYVEEGVFSA